MTNDQAPMTNERQVPLVLGIWSFCLEKRDEAGLLKMVIGGQSFFDVVLLHHDEGDAVGEGPVFVGPNEIQL